MSELQELTLFDLSRLEGYLVELLSKLERIATVMERFDNVMNPTLGLAEAELTQQMTATEPSTLSGITFRPPPDLEAFGRGRHTP